MQKQQEGKGERGERGREGQVTLKRRRKREQRGVGFQLFCKVVRILLAAERSKADRDRDG